MTAAGIGTARDSTYLRSQCPNRSPNVLGASRCGVGFEISGQFADRVELRSLPHVRGGVQGSSPYAGVGLVDCAEPGFEGAGVRIGALSYCGQRVSQSRILAPSEDLPSGLQTRRD